MDRINAGAPVIIIQPGTVYGPNDHSAIGIQLGQAFHGTLPCRALEDVGVTPVHVEDVAVGVVAAVDRGTIGEAYVMAGPPIRHGEALQTAARAGGHPLPRLRVPASVLHALAPLVGLIPAAMAVRLGLPPNLAEVVSASDGVTYW